METLRHWKQPQANLEVFKNQVALGEFSCAYNPTCSGRHPGYAPRDEEQRCQNVATHVETVSRVFVMGKYVYDVPLCSEHSGWNW